MAFVFIPGGFCPGAYFSKVTDKLTALGYTAIWLDNPSSNGQTDKTPAPGFYDDVAYVDNVITDLADEGKDVILVGNSYGGFIATQAGQGLSRDERQARSGLAAIVLIGSLLGPLGITCNELVSAEVPVDMDSQASAYLTPLDPKIAGQFLFPSLDEEEQFYWANMARPQSKTAFSQKLTYASYEHYPTTVVSPMNDKCIRPSLHNENFEAALAKGLKTIKQIKIDADHCAMISHPDKIVEILLEVANDA